jgi:hypothetical protein
VGFGGTQINTDNTVEAFVVTEFENEMMN